MSREPQPIPVSTFLNGFYKKVHGGNRSGVDKRVVYLGFQVILNALFIGVIAKGLIYLIDAITNLAFYGRFSFLPATPAGNNLGWIVILIPLIGGIGVGFMARFGSKAIGGHGIPEAMEKIILGESRIPPILTFLKPLSAALSIGTGGPFGAEGPIIATGGAFGSLTGQWMHISASERKIMLAAGACSGMAAIFGTPLAAILLAVELLLFEFSPKSIIPVALGCITGAGMHLLLFGSQPVFLMAHIPFPTDSSLIAYLVLGLIIGVASVGVSKSVYAVEDLFEKLPLHWMWWPAIGALAIGIVGFFAPSTMGVGYENIHYLLNGSWSLTALLSLCILKFISWVVSLGSGTSGGTLAPLLTIGGALGALLGIFALYLFPGLPVNLPTVALIGMAAMFAGASRALLTSIVFAFETTGQSAVLLPLVTGCITAYGVSFFLMKGSIMTEKIRRRGVNAPDRFVPDVLHGITVKDFLSPLTEGAETLPYLFEEDEVELAAVMMGKFNKDSLVVLNNHQKKIPVGVITASTILHLYSEQKSKDVNFDSPGSTKRLLVHGRKFWALRKKNN